MRESYGVEGSGLARLVRAAYDLLDLITFFTAGEDKEAVARPLRPRLDRLGGGGDDPHRDPGRLHQGRGDRLAGAGRVRRLRAGPRQGPAADRGPRLRRRRRRRDHDQGLGPRRALGFAMDEGARFPRVAARPATTRASTSRPAGRAAAGASGSATPSTSGPGAEPNASIWFVLFDREADGPAGDQGDGAGGASCRPRRAPGSGSAAPRSARARPSGSIETEALQRRPGTLTFSGDAEPCKYLPADWLYEAPVPKTKFVAPFPTPASAAGSRSTARSRSSSTAGRG